MHIRRLRRVINADGEIAWSELCERSIMRSTAIKLERSRIAINRTPRTGEPRRVRNTDHLPPPLAISFSYRIS
jgi:hypothetical protein